MLDIGFISKDGSLTNSVELTEDFYFWLAKSEFSKIGKSVRRKIQIDGEEDKLSVVQLSKGNSKKLKQFFRDEVVRESDAVITKLGDSPSKEEYQAGTYRLRKMLELLKCVENENYQYLQRI